MLASGYTLLVEVAEPTELAWNVIDIQRGEVEVDYFSVARHPGAIPQKARLIRGIGRRVYA